MFESMISAAFDIEYAPISGLAGHACIGGDVDHASGARGQVRVAGARVEERSAQVHGDRSVEVGDRRIDQPGLDGDARVVDQDVEPAEPFDRERDRRVDLVPGGGIGPTEPGPGSECLGSLGAKLLVAAGHHDRGALGQEPLRDRESDPGRASGHERRLAVEAPHAGETSDRSMGLLLGPERASLGRCRPGDSARRVGRS
jgi:hypothetical protein